LEEAGGESIMNSIKHLVAPLFGLPLLCSLINAQDTSSAGNPAPVPRLVNYSGKAIDSQGKVVSGMVGLTFAIYKQQEDSTPLWTETQNIEADAEGKYTVQLGATKPEGLPQDLFSSGEARWLGVGVDGGIDQPRVLLLSVPYALKAADADTLGGLPASAFLTTGSPGAQSSTSPAAPTVAVAAVPGVTPATTPSGSGTTDFVPLWDQQHESGRLDSVSEWQHHGSARDARIARARHGDQLKRIRLAPI
jgi:trimeric autotransporter adhesin